MSLALALMAAINGSTGSSATLACGSKAPSLAGVSPRRQDFHCSEVEAQAPRDTGL